MRRRGGDGAHDQGEILLSPAAVEHFHHIVCGAGGESTGRNPDALDVVDLVRLTARGGEPLTEVVSEPLGTVRTHQHQIEVVDQPRFALRCNGAAGFVGPRQRDVNPVGGVERERVQQAEAWREDLFVVHVGIERR